MNSPTALPVAGRPLPSNAVELPPAIERLLAQPGVSYLPAADIEGFRRSAGNVALFLWALPRRNPEVLDVAIVLPELMKACRAAGLPEFQVGVVEEASERSLGARYGTQLRPALVFLRDGGYVTTIEGMLDWQPFVERVAQALQTPVSRPPSVGIAVVAADAKPDSGCAA